MAVSTYIVDKDGNQIDASTATVPSDRHFRGAWSLNGSVISEDMDSARAIFRDKIREARKPLLRSKGRGTDEGTGNWGQDTTAIATAKDCPS
jgi:hypothetical protein